MAGRTYVLAMLAACAVIASIVAGCGSGGGDSGSTTSLTVDKSVTVEQAKKVTGDAAGQVDDRLKAAGYPVKVESAAPNAAGVYSVSFEGGPAKGGYSITAYVYETAEDAVGEGEAFDSAFGGGAPGAMEVEVVESRLYLAAAGPEGAVPAGALDEFIKVAEGT